MILEDATCGICHHKGAAYVFSGPDRLLRLPGNFHVVRCNYCGAFYQWPRLSWNELKNYYNETYDSYASALQDDPHLIRRLVRRVYPLKMRRFVERFCRSGRLLDVGCGSGIFLEEMQRTGAWELQGVEPTVEAAAYVKQRFGIPVIEQTFEQADLPPSYFDVVTLWNVFEHVESPLLTLQKIHYTLKPERYLILSVPNYESLSRHFFGKYWCGWDLPRHLFVIPRATLIWMLERAGFRTIMSKCFLISYAVFGHSLEFWQQDWPETVQPLASLLRRVYYSPVGRLGSYPFQVLTEYLGLSSVKTWVFQKVGGQESFRLC